ncbi:MAG: hypothetical protein JNN11_04425 [Candidatus Doudnabacteria bacterium]|nr:hypothetical protein [Candidatus Doudnabacteria bacterium]
MTIIVHRVNTIEKLKTIPSDFGVEIDVRHDNRTGRLYLNHDPGDGKDLEEYLKNFHHSFIIFNIKEAGIEQACLNLATTYNLPPTSFFLLDVEFPYLYKASRQKGIKNIAVRYSEAEPIEMTLTQKGFVEWVWIDVNTKLPLNANIVEELKGFKTCLVSPECWGRPEDIKKYTDEMKNLNFTPNAVMCDFEYIEEWK